MKENKENHQEKDRVEAPLPEVQKRAGGQRALSVILAVLTCAVAVPVFLIYLIKSPSPLQDVYTFGISFYRLVFIFLISAVSIIFSVLFFVRFRLLVNLTILILSLFCCVPLIIGLKNEFTLQQAILSTPFFAHWPFFLRPLYILIEFLLPMGVLIFLFLQLKNIFSRGLHGYIFLGASLYLAAAAFIGFSGLLQAGEPTIITALARYDNSELAPEGHQAALERVSVPHAAKEQELHSYDSQLPGPQGEMTLRPENDREHSALPVKDSDRALVDYRGGSLKGKAHSISDTEVRVKTQRADQIQAAHAPFVLSSPAMPDGLQPLDKGVLAKMDYRLGLLSDRVNQIAETLEELKNPEVERRQPATVEIRQKVDLLTLKVDQILSRLSQSEYFNARRQDLFERNDEQSSTTSNQSVSSRELAGVLNKIEHLSDKVNLVSEMLIEKGGDNTEER